MRFNGKHLDKYRKVHPSMGKSPNGALFGYFRVRVGDSTLAVISSGERHERTGVGSWEHVSVSVYPLAKRTPTWEEMAEVKKLFWKPEETVVEFHPADSDYVNVYDCLHLWKPPYALELPPTITLAPQKTGR